MRLHHGHVEEDGRGQRVPQLHEQRQGRQPAEGDGAATDHLGGGDVGGGASEENENKRACLMSAIHSLPPVALSLSLCQGGRRHKRGRRRRRPFHLPPPGSASCNNINNNKTNGAQHGKGGGKGGEASASRGLCGCLPEWRWREGGKEEGKEESFLKWPLHAKTMAEAGERERERGSANHGCCSFAWVELSGGGRVVHGCVCVRINVNSPAESSLSLLIPPLTFTDRRLRVLFHPSCYYYSKLSIRMLFLDMNTLKKKLAVNSASPSRSLSHID